MKTTILSTALLISSAAVFFQVNVSGDDHGAGDQACCEEDKIEGSEDFEAKITLTATTNAPSGATGVAKLEGQNENGVATASLELRLSGLNSGDYFLTAVKQSDGSSVTLGQFTIQSGNVGKDDDNDQSEENDGQNSNGENNGQIEVLLPEGLDVTDISQLLISDSDGNLLLMGDLVNPNPATTLKFHAFVRISPAQGAPGARGKAQLQSTLLKRKRQNRFTLVASDVPANATFQVHVNGNNVGTVKSSKAGKVTLKKLPPIKSQIRSVRLTGSQGRTVVSAKF